ncbi:hypothetical protein EO087_06855 [Dyella sp. M7H15-1]|uniref:hypothetical protein n=1 Tax=Dyella sp. M7H15-1 TaxID=2501295 RepID=UPI0010050B81|nr:hypothetical protein [Dyella sp. M7H15-1]QAU23733.1 hypothetical protein EO087_06855 [Dyella sp. M7H15-1]
MDAHVPQRKGVVRLDRILRRRGWPAWVLAIAWALLLACMPWWIDLLLLLGLVAIQLTLWPRWQRFNRTLRRALRWGLAGLLVAAYRALQGYELAPTLTLLAALIGFSLLVLLESWQDHKPLRSAAIAAAEPEWSELALSPSGPAVAIIELQAPIWLELDGARDGISVDVAWIDGGSCRIGACTQIDHIEPRLAVAPGQGWLALPITSGRGVVLYDRANERQYRLHGWQLYGWHAGEAWLSCSEDQPPLALSHVLGQDQLEEL